MNPTGSVVVTYNKGGGAQSTTLTFDTVDQFANLESDRTVFPTGANVHLTLTDIQLNIDPTDEDSWTWGTNSSNSTVYYQLFTENGVAAADGTDGAIDLSSNLGTDAFMFEDNGILLIDIDAQGTDNEVLRIIDNGDSNTNGDTVTEASDVTTDGASMGINSQPVTFTEISSNSGLFSNYDESDVSNLAVATDAARGVSASIDYNETPKTVLVGFDFGTIDIQPVDDEWNSGEEIPVVLVDGDANLNSRVDEDLDLFNPDVPLIPSLQTGNPFTLGEGGVGTSTVAKALFLNNTVVVNATAVTGAGFFGINASSTAATSILGAVSGANATVVVDKFSDRAILNANNTADFQAKSLVIDLGVTASELYDSIANPEGSGLTADRLLGYNLFNNDFRSINQTGTFSVFLLNNSGATVATNNIIATATSGATNLNGSATAVSIVNSTGAQSISLLNSTGTTLADVDQNIALGALFDIDEGDRIGLLINFDTAASSYTLTAGVNEAIVADFFTFGFLSSGEESGERIANQLIRIEVEETGDNTSTFQGTLEYIMLNQLNILDDETYTDLSTIADDPSFIVIEDLTDEDSPRVNYLDLGSDGVSTQVADQEEAPSHSGIVSFDSDSYKTADTVTITLEDLDLNTNSDLVDIYTTVSPTQPTTANDAVSDTVGEAGLITGLSFGDLGRLLDITFDDTTWKANNNPSAAVTTDCADTIDAAIDNGLAETGFTLIETSQDSGIFMGDFQIPSQFCRNDTAGTTPESVTGLDIEVNYVDFRDASGEIIEVGDSAGVRASTGSVSLDRTVYPVPFGLPSDVTANTSESPEGRSVFPVHATGMSDAGTSLDSGEFLNAGDLTLHIRVNDPDFDISASGEDQIGELSADSLGPVKISVIRGSDAVVLGFAGGPSSGDGTIQVGSTVVSTDDQIELGPLVEIAPDAGIFEIDVVVRYTDGPASTTCPVTNVFTNTDGAGTAVTDRFESAPASGENFCILQGDILQVEYTDPADASGDPNTVTDSATFDLRNGVLQSDKSVYIIGSDMILTLIEPDFDLDNDGAETYDLDLIEWDSDAATITMGDLGGEGAAFDPEPSNFRETGDSTGIFQIVIEIPEELDSDRLERGEESILEYTDWGPSGSDYVGDEDEDVNLTIFTSNFGATVELDQKVYTWTDKVYLTIVAPDHNFDGDLIDEIGDTDLDPIKVSTRGFDIDNYKLVETGTDTGIFTGEIILTGFAHDADGIGGDDTNPRTSDDGSGPTDGFLQTDDDDGLTISFEFSEDETVVGSSLIRWNIGEVQWLEASYPASGTGVVRTIDPDMNLDPEAVDNFDVDVWSDSDAGGIDLTVTETNEATGIFEGTVFFTVTDESSGHRLRVAEGDTVTAEYEDNTLPDPYTTADELDITATSLIGTVVPPLERAPAANLRTVDAFGNSLDTVSVDQQVQISADLANGQDREQTFAYLVQIQDGNGVTVSLAWITGSLSAGQSFSPALSWIPTEAGTYTATAFVWESVDNPTALSPPVTTIVTVQ